MKIDNLVAELFRKNDLNNSQEASKAKLQRKNQSGNEGQKASGKEQQVFSYISLLGRQTESFPHRTQPIIDGGGRRKSSSSQSLVEEKVAYLKHTKKSNFLARSNPIGLAEPSGGNDGLAKAVAKDGSLYRSTESLSGDQSSGGGRSQRSWSFSRDRNSLHSTSSSSQRRSSLTSLSTFNGMGIRAGSGLIATGKPVNALAMPFGSMIPATKATKRKQGQQKVVKAEEEISDASTFIRNGIQEIQSLTEAANGKKTSTKDVDNAFKAVDVMLKGTLASSCQEAEAIEVTINRRQRRDSCTFTRKEFVLPEQNVTISLPASRRTSRNPSVDRSVGSRLRNKSRTSSIEVFNATYDMKLTRRSSVKQERKMSAEIVEVESKFFTKVTETEDNSDEDDDQAEVEPVPETEAGEGQTNCQTNAKAEEALPGLATALESLQRQQKASLINGVQDKSKANGVTTSASISLRGSRGSSPANTASSMSSSSTERSSRSRRRSLELYSADVNVKLRPRSRSSSVETESSCHIRCKNPEIRNDLKLCNRCHNPDHHTNACQEFNQLLCPRCLEWSHWEDTCPQAAATCGHCGQLGHEEKVHFVKDFKQRRAVVDFLGWTCFQDWFYDLTFRRWWQLNGCTGVPLYKVYKRSTEWRHEVAPLEDNILNDIEQAGLIAPDRPARRFKTNYKLERDDSIEDLMKEINKPRPKLTEEDLDSGRSTPEHLKKYSGVSEDNEVNKDQNGNNNRRIRTYSETLKMLDEDILSELSSLH